MPTMFTLRIRSLGWVYEEFPFWFGPFYASPLLFIRFFSVVPMPSSQYYLHAESTTVCSLDKETSSIQALSLGRTNVVLLSQNVDLKAKTGIRPPSTLINVVEPDSLQWAVSGNNWILQQGKTYKLHVQLLDAHGNQMFIGDVSHFPPKCSNFPF